MESRYSRLSSCVFDCPLNQSESYRCIWDFSHHVDKILDVTRCQTTLLLASELGRSTLHQHSSSSYTNTSSLSFFVSFFPASPESLRLFWVLSKIVEHIMIFLLMFLMLSLTTTNSSKDNPAFTINHSTRCAQHHLHLYWSLEGANPIAFEFRTTNDYPLVERSITRFHGTKQGSNLVTIPYQWEGPISRSMNVTKWFSEFQFRIGYEQNGQNRCQWTTIYPFHLGDCMHCRMKNRVSNYTELETHQNRIM